MIKSSPSVTVERHVPEPDVPKPAVPKQEPVKPDVPKPDLVPKQDVPKQEDPEVDMVEVELNIEDIPDENTIQLKRRDDVYYNMYRDAKKKAKESKLVALSNYLEAKRIKTAYLLDDSDSESDEDLADWETILSKS